MDPITQTLLGAAAVQAVFGRRLGRMAALFGSVGGELPDIDVFVPPTDAALPMEFHRHFTHALLFIPLGGVLAALPFMLLGRWRRDWKLVLAATTLGCATHALLDTCTSYGTYLLWPFVDRRLAWDIISIIDPIFSLFLLVGILWSMIAGAVRPARIALGLCALYLGLGVVQHQRAVAVQRTLAAGRAQEIERGRVMPTLGNLVVWRSVYEADGRLHSDGVRLPNPGRAASRAGSSVPLVTLEELETLVMGDPRQIRILEGFVAFADGYVARMGDDPRAIGDMRYSLTTSGFDPIWGIRIEDEGLRLVFLGGDRGPRLGDLWDEMVSGRNYSR